MAVVEASAQSSAPREAVWSVVADLRSWADWGPWELSDIERAGAPDPNGLGTIRLMRSDRRRMGRKPLLREEVNVFDPLSRFGYTLLSGLPLKDYQATIELTDAGEGTELRYRIEFAGKVPGVAALTRSVLDPFVRDVAERIAREAERR